MSLIFAVLASVGANNASPIGKVIEMLSDLETKIIGEGETAQKLYEEFAEWCEDRNRQLSFEIKTGKSGVTELEAIIEKASDTIDALQSKVEDLAASIATTEGDLKAATGVRAAEAGDFATEEKELLEIIDQLTRAIGILEREQMQGGAALLQLKGAKDVVQVLNVMVQASLFSSADASHLTQFVQTAQDADDGDNDADSPAAASYENHSSDIIETLKGLVDKAEEQLANARQKEEAALRNFKLLQQSLQDEIKYANKDMAEAKKKLGASTETKSTSEGDLVATKKDLKEDITAKADLHHSCMTKAQDFEAETTSRGEELKALATAKKVIKEATGGAEKITYGLDQVSFLQVARTQITSRSQNIGYKMVKFVRDLARKHHSKELALLASQMRSVVHLGDTNGDDPFAKVKGLISDMIAKLEDEAANEASKKSYCDKELSETNEKKDAKSKVVNRLTTKIDQMAAKAAKLKEEVATLQKELAALASSQAEMDQLRQKEHDMFVTDKAELDKGLEGIKLALKVLRKYYAQTDTAHDAAQGAGSGIIGLLEVVESDFAKGIAEMTSEEETAVAAYESETKENELEKTAKDQDVKYKSKEAASLGKAIAEAKNDRAAVKSQLDAVLEYLDELKGQCIAKAETYAERKAQREQELAGLKEALTILESETALIQRTSRHTLRGAQPHQKIMF